MYDPTDFLSDLRSRQIIEDAKLRSEILSSAPEGSQLRERLILLMDLVQKKELESWTFYGKQLLIAALFLTVLLAAVLTPASPGPAQGFIVFLAAISTAIYMEHFADRVLPRFRTMVKNNLEEVRRILREPLSQEALEIIAAKDSMLRRKIDSTFGQVSQHSQG